MRSFKLLAAGVLTIVAPLIQSPVASAAAVPEMNVVVRRIHHELLKLKSKVPFMREYTDGCLTSDKGRAIIQYSPPEPPTQGPAPQQSSHVTITYVAAEQKHEGKYWNVVEDVKACNFPDLRSKIYAEVLIWGDEKLASQIEQIVVRVCEHSKKQRK